jgi:hypothetical protein
MAGCYLRQALMPVGGFKNLVSMGFETDPEQAAQLQFIVNNNDDGLLGSFFLDSLLNGHGYSQSLNTTS